MLIIWITIGILGTLLILMIFLYSILFIIKKKYEGKLNKMKKALILIHDGFEDSEFVVTYDVLKTNNVSVDIFKLENKNIVSKHGLNLDNGIYFKDLDLDNYDALIIPGGPGIEKIKDNSDLSIIVRNFNSKNKLIAAICAAPQVLAYSEILENKKVVSYEDENIYQFLERYKANVLRNVKNNDLNEVFQDGNIITAINYQSSFKFAFKILENLNQDGKF